LDEPFPIAGFYRRGPLCVCPAFLPSGPDHRLDGAACHWPGLCCIAGAVVSSFLPGITEKITKEGKGLTSIYPHEKNPINLVVRFLLELVLLFALAYWGWVTHSGLLRFVFAILLLLAAGILWGVFRVPGDESANGKAPVPVPGWLRLVLELGLFTLAAWCFFDAKAILAGVIFSAITVLHYLLSYDRIAWLLKTGR
jgi:hypothetical protein